MTKGALFGGQVGHRFGFPYAENAIDLFWFLTGSPL
jgi:hypothetical protein